VKAVANLARPLARQDCTALAVVVTTTVCTIAAAAAAAAEGSSFRTGDCVLCDSSRCDTGVYVDGGRYLDGCQGLSPGTCRLCQGCGPGQYRSGCTDRSPGTCLNCTPGFSQDQDASVYVDACTPCEPGTVAATSGLATCTVRTPAWLSTSL
jgi:hypothetical protein